MTAKLRILLADDHETVREGLRMILNAQPDMQVVATVGDGRAADATLAHRQTIPAQVNSRFNITDSLIFFPAPANPRTRAGYADNP